MPCEGVSGADENGSSEPQEELGPQKKPEQLDSTTKPNPPEQRIVWAPAGHEPEDSEVPLDCASCGQGWMLGAKLRGCRVRCSCGAWMDVPKEEAALALPRELGLAILGETTRQEEDLELPSHGIYVDGAFEKANHASKNRWVSLTILDLSLVMAGFWGIQIAFFFLLPAGREDLLLPLSTPVIGIWVLLIAYWRKGMAFRGLHLTKPRFFFEALGACALFLGCAILLTMLVRGGEDPNPLKMAVRSMGLPLAIGVIAAFPAFFEEIAFRGLVLGRLTPLMGGSLGAWVAGLAFALAHGVSFAFPLLLAIGVYLSYLRIRSGSLLPGMVLHFLYNGLLVFMDMG